MKTKQNKTKQKKERILSIIVSLFQFSKGQSRLRLLAKFVDDDYEKVDRIVELHFEYFSKVQNAIQKIEQRKKEIIENDEEIDDEKQLEFDSMKLDGGFLSLQFIDLIILYICTYEDDITVFISFFFLFLFLFHFSHSNAN